MNYLNYFENKDDMKLSNYIIDNYGRESINSFHEWVYGRYEPEIVKYIKSELGLTSHFIHKAGQDLNNIQYIIFEDKLGNTLDINIKEFPEKKLIAINLITTSTIGTGLGKRIIECIKKYAESNKFRIRVDSVTNAAFWDKVGFTPIDGDKQFYQYLTESTQELIQHSYNSIDELSKNLREIAIWGINGEYSSTGCFDDNEDMEDVIQCVLGDFNHTINSEYPEGFKNMPDVITIYRLITLNSVHGFNSEDLGSSWFARKNHYIEHPEFFQMLDHIRGNVYELTGTTHISNIDFPNTIWHRSTQYYENEIRVIEPKKVKLISKKNLVNRR